jgi:N-acetyl-gamma-glutamyl-phosphate reductase
VHQSKVPEAGKAPLEKARVSVRVGIVGVSGAGGSELLRLVTSHPTFELKYVGGASSAGQALDEIFPALAGQSTGRLAIQRFVPEEIGDLDLLFTSMSTGESREPLARVSDTVKILDLGGDHRFVEGWVYGLPELPGARERIRAAPRVAGTGCYAVASLLALAPLVALGMIEIEGIVVDAKSGVSGAGRGSGGGGGYPYVDTNEDVFAYGLHRHAHVPEIQKALSLLAGGERKASIAFTPHLLPMTRGILATCYARPRGATTTERLHDAALEYYAGEPFVKVLPTRDGRSVHSKWATGSNLAFVSYAVNAETGLAVAVGAIDNLGKGAAGQAVQNANLMTAQPETAGLTGLPLVP